jgi:hypothetical protein
MVWYEKMENVSKISGYVSYQNRSFSIEARFLMNTICFFSLFFMPTNKRYSTTHNTSKVS